MRPPPPVCYFTGVALPSLKFPCSSARQWPRQTKKTACCHQWPTSGLDVGGVPCCFSRGNVVFKLWGMVKGVSVSYYHTLENEKTHGLKWSSDIGECNCYILLEMVSFQKKTIWFRETHRRTETYWKARNGSTWWQNTLFSIVVRHLMASTDHQIREHVFRLMLFSWLLWQWWNTSCHDNEMEIEGTSLFRGGGFINPCLFFFP